MATRKKNTKPVPVIVATSADDGAEWIATHPFVVDPVVITPRSGTVPQSVGSIHVTRAMVGHHDRVKLLRKIRGHAGLPEGDTGTDDDDSPPAA
jgi:hypothetical protein